MEDILDRTTCPTRKVRYLSEEQAEENLAQIFQQRVEEARDRPPERQVYQCQYCDGWHLSSKPPELDPPEPPRFDGETWEAYAKRLEKRIKAQRDHINRVNLLRADAGNRAERKRVNRLEMALGKERLANYQLAEMNRALVEKLKERDKT